MLFNLFPLPMADLEFSKRSIEIRTWKWNTNSISGLKKRFLSLACEDLALPFLVIARGCHLRHRRQVAMFRRWKNTWEGRYHALIGCLGTQLDEVGHWIRVKGDFHSSNLSIIIAINIKRVCLCHNEITVALGVDEFHSISITRVFMHVTSPSCS